MAVAVSVSLDNVTIVADEAMPGAVEHIVGILEARRGMKQGERLLKRAGVGRWPYREYYLFTDGTYLQKKDSRADHVLDWRIEFNPNKCDQDDVKAILHAMVRGRITRLDFAVDYRGIDLSGFEWLDLGHRKRRIFQDGVGRLETRYMGDGYSDEMIRIYNKALEQGVDGLWWRVESVNRYEKGDVDFFARAFVNCAANKLGGDELGWEERAKLEYLAAHPEVWATLSEGTRRKYKRLQALGCSPLDPSPRSVLEAEQKRLQGEIQDWLFHSSGIPSNHYEGVELRQLTAREIEKIQAELDECTDTSGTVGTTYSYTVTAKNAGGVGPESTAVTAASLPEPDTTPPDAPSGLTLTAGDGYIQISWTAATAGDLAGYRVRLNGGAPISVTGTTYQATGLVNGTSYNVSVTSVDTSGNESSAVIGSATPADAPGPYDGFTKLGLDHVIGWIQATQAGFKSMVGYGLGFIVLVGALWWLINMGRRFIGGAG